MAAEDAAVITRLFGSVQGRQDIPKAFQAFDKIRRGPDSRTDFVVRNGAQVAMLCAGQKGLDPSTALQGLDNMSDLFARLWQGDIKREIQDALDVFNGIKSKD